MNEDSSWVTGSSRNALTFHSPGQYRSTIRAPVSTSRINLPDRCQACSCLYEVNAISFLRHHIRTVDCAPHSRDLPREPYSSRFWTWQGVVYCRCVLLNFLERKTSLDSHVFYQIKITLSVNFWKHKEIFFNKQKLNKAKKPTTHICVWSVFFASRVGDFAPWRRIWTQPRMRAHNLLGADSRFCDDLSRLHERWFPPATVSFIHTFSSPLPTRSWVCG